MTKDILNFMGEHPILTFFIAYFIFSAIGSIFSFDKAIVHKIVCSKCKEEVQDD